MIFKTWVTIYVYSDEPFTKIVQHRSKGGAQSFIFEEAKNAYNYNKKAFWEEPVEMYDDVWYINDTDYYEIRLLEIDTSKEAYK